jgi:hypothetical protein
MKADPEEKAVCIRRGKRNGIGGKSSTWRFKDHAELCGEIKRQELLETGVLSVLNEIETKSCPRHTQKSA